MTFINKTGWAFLLFSNPESNQELYHILTLISPNPEPPRGLKTCLELQRFIDPACKVSMIGS
jgi:hypothetical protein